MELFKATPEAIKKAAEAIECYGPAGGFLESTAHAVVQIVLEEVRMVLVKQGYTLIVVPNSDSLIAPKL